MTVWYEETLWGSDYHEEIAAHEAGHMMGLFDEYVEPVPGALDPNVDPSTLPPAGGSIMADLGPARQWHFEAILDWLSGNVERNFEFAPSPLPPYDMDEPIPDFHDAHPTDVPEPGTWALLLAGLAIVGIRRRRSVS